MQIKIIYAARKSEKTYADSIDDYLNRIRLMKYKIETKNIDIQKDTPISALVVKEEAAAFERQIARDEYLIILDDKGKSYTSEKFAQQIQSLANRSSKVCFLIGGAYGVDQELKQKANELLSLSTFTLPHQLARLVLSEQIYRALSIINNSKYHH
ncbi:MAG: 23S rRNA (pseudouridine(1915)-N(3))-methyltransferase RlmH [Bacteroidetes bacterium]|nr:23S rRNA (pseudouridine(1915)-N(3))-methyltransferase RlmH [Bacteroidota bacterium]